MNEASALDYLPRRQLENLQLHRLMSTLERVYANVAMFRERMQEKGWAPADIQSLSDIRKLPFLSKSDLLDTYPFGLFASPMEEIVRLHASSGTTGKPVVVAYTKEDIEVWTSVMVRSFASCGLHRGDIIQNAYAYGLFTGGLGVHYGAEGLGATVVPTSGGNTDRQISVMKDFGVSAICCTPSYFLHLVERARELGVDMRSLPLRVGIFGAEPWSESLRGRMEQESGIKAYDVYGLSEVIGPGAAIECEFQQGLHIFEDHFFPEIVDPETGETLPDGEEGELVITTLSKKALPVIRYRTRDITAIIPEPCPCGRTIRRLKRISRRSDDMLIVRGVNIYPSQVEEALLSVKGTLPHYQIILKRERGLDDMTVEVEVTSEVFSDKVRTLETLHHQLSGALERTLGIRAHLRLVEPNTIKRSEGKARHVIDRRELGS